MDFLRAASIVVVVLGHWLMAAPTIASGEGFTLSDMLRIAPWSQWLTWIFQVMPLFFLVGGYANAASWQSARRSGVGYAAWVSHRLQRLVRPLWPLLLFWMAIAIAARGSLGESLAGSGSQVALSPTWFLAVYVMVVVVAPSMHSAWERFGMASVWGLVLAAALVDTAARRYGVDAASWLNFGFVWLAIHQLGYAWRDGTLSSPVRALTFAVAGFAALVVLVGLASYPVSMVTVPGATAANSSPPTLALLALGATQAGLVLSLEGPARRLLRGAAVWTTTVLINAVIMTVYLWHATVIVLVVALAEWPGGLGLRFVPDTPAWWATRAPWVIVLTTILAGFVAMFGSVEARSPRRRKGAAVAGWTSVVGSMALCAGLVTMTVEGIGAADRLGVHPWAVLLALTGAGLVTIPPFLAARSE